MKQPYRRMIEVAVAACAAFVSAVEAQERKDLAGVAECKLVWEYPTPGDVPQAIVADAQNRPVLYAAMKQGGLVVLDNARPEQAPKELVRVGIDKLLNLQVMHLTQSGEFLYLALGEFFNANGAPAGLAVVNVKNPRQPQVLSVWKSDEVLKGSAMVLVDGNIAYLAAMKAGVMTFDVSNPRQLQRLSAFQPDIHFPRRDPNRIHHPNARGLAIRDTLLFVAYDAGGLRVLDVSDHANPREIGRYVNTRMANKQQAFNSVVIDGNLAYAAVDYAGLEILDIRDPRNIRQVGWWNPWEADTLKNLWFNSPGHTNQLAFDPERKLAWMSAGDSELLIVDVSKPAQPRLTAKFGGPGNKLGVWGVSLVEDRAYLSYINAAIPFNGTWSGIKAVRR